MEGKGREGRADRHMLEEGCVWQQVRLVRKGIGKGLVRALWTAEGNTGPGPASGQKVGDA